MLCIDRRPDNHRYNHLRKSAFICGSLKPYPESAETRIAKARGFSGGMMSRLKGSEKKKKAERVALGPYAPAFARSLGETTGRLLRPLLPLTVLAGTYVVVSFMLWRPVNGEPSRSAAGQSRLTAAAIRDAVTRRPCPGWMTRQDFEQVAGIGLLAGGHSVFEPGLSRMLACAYESSPWVERVQALRLRFPAQMDLEIEWRKPVARVERGSLVLDHHGVVLNLMADGAAARDLPLLAGVPCGRTEVGKQVPEKDLQDGLELLGTVNAALRSSPGNLKIASVVREPAGTWRVLTDRGPTIYWGAFTDDPPVDEPRTHEKAELLRRRLCESKEPALLEYVKVYHAQAPVKPRAKPAGAGMPAVSGTKQNGKGSRG
jgi:hypothetical protein